MRSACTSGSFGSDRMTALADQRDAGNLAMTPAVRHPFSLSTFLSTAGEDRTLCEHRRDAVIFREGDPADAVFYVVEGWLKLSVDSHHGREAIIGILGERAFFGEGCLNGQPLRLATAIALTPCRVLRLRKSRMISLLRDEPDFVDLFTRYLLVRNSRIEEDLLDQLVHSSEMRLARTLLMLADVSEEGQTREIAPHITQATLAEIVGTTRPRVSHFMNKFRKSGFISYDSHLHVRVHGSLLSVVLRGTS
jgi:CRP-like cAMP-binding protein